MRKLISSLTGKLAFCLLLAILMLAPLPFGSNTPEASIALAGLCGLTLVLTLAAIAVSPEPFTFDTRWPLRIALLCFGLFTAWILVQVIPGLPGGLAHPLWSDTARILNSPSVAGTISLDPETTWWALAKTTGYFAIGLSATLLLRTPERREVACNALVLSGALYAIYGLGNLALGDCCVVWQPKTSYFGVVTGPFINRNSFATYLGLVTVLTLAHLLRELGELSEVTAGSGWRIVTLFKLIFIRRWLMLMALPVLVAALLLTLSRGGIIATALGATVLALLLSLAGVLGRKRRWLNVLFFLAVTAGTIFMFGSAFLSRIETDGFDEAYRGQSWKIMVSGIEASPWLGHGFGTFPEAFPLYRDDRLPSRRFWDKAHNTYLELALDTGIPATALFLLGYAALGSQCLRGLKRRRRERRIFPAVGLAAMALAGAHSLLDFSLQIPAVATIFAILLGIAITESGIWRSAGSQDQPAAT